jgi:mono/diheme cytochrome c family protein
MTGCRWLAATVVAVSVLAGCDRTDAASGSEPDAEPEVAEFDSALAANLPPGVTPELAETGRVLFLPCAVCHGLDGRGNQLGPSLRDTEWTHITGTLEEIERVIRDGVPAPRDYPVPMAPMGGGDFDDEELRAVAAYVFAISRSTPTPAQ